MTEKDALVWIAKLFDQPVDKLTSATSRDDIPMWDSLGVLTLMAEFDGKFGIVLTDADMRGMRKVGDIFEVLRRNGKWEQESHEIRPG